MSKKDTVTVLVKGMRKATVNNNNNGVIAIETDGGQEAFLILPPKALMAMSIETRRALTFINSDQARNADFPDRFFDAITPDFGRVSVVPNKNKKNDDNKTEAMLCGETNDGCNVFFSIPPNMIKSVIEDLQKIDKNNSKPIADLRVVH